MKQYHQEWRAFITLMHTIPSWILTLFALSVLAMNLLANKSIQLPVDWLALDSGIIVSWFAFLAMDTITKYFGPKAATQLSFVVIGFNLLFCLLFWIGSCLPGMWGEAFVEGQEEVINSALNHTIGGTWYVVLGSTIAFCVACVVNNFSNWAIGQRFKKNPDGFIAYAMRAYVSTSLAQFIDNLLFALLVSHIFFDWSLLQCLTCAFTGMIVELVFEIFFAVFGYKIARYWQKEGIGKAYFEALGKR